MASKVSGIIEKIQTGSGTHAIAATAYGYCETAANEPAKTVDMDGFKLNEGVTIHVKFKNSNSASNPTLNVQDTGAKPIIYGTTIKDNTDNIYGWNANDILTLTYDGINWVISNSAYATSAGSVSSGNIRPIKSKTFITKLYNSPSSGDNFYQTVFNVTPDTYDAIWKIRYRLTFTVSGHNDYNAIYDCDMSGRSQNLYSYHCYNSLVTYPIYYHVLFRGSSLSYPHEVGFRIASSSGDTTIQKTVKVDIIEAINCTISLFDEIKSYKNVTVTGYARTDITATSNGLQETGDSDSYAYYVYSNGFRMTAGANKVLRYTFFGRLADGTYESFTITSNTTNTSKIKNPNGFLPDGKIYYNSNSSDYVGITGVTIYEQYYSIDYRYTFNISTTAIPASAQTYIVFTYNTSDGLLYLDDTWFTTTPNQIGKIYQRIGNNYYAQDDYRGSLLLNNPYYIYDGEDLQVWQPYAEKANTVPLSGVSNADNLKAIEAISGTSGLLKKTAANTWTLDTNNYVTSSGVTKVSTGAGLTGGDITTTGTISINGMNTSSGATNKWLNQKGEWTTPPNDDTHYTTKLIAGGSSATSNAAVSSGNIYLRLFDDSTHRNNIQLKSGNNMTITSDANGIITFTSSYTDTKNTAGSTNSTSKLFLIGATTQAANPTTNSYQYTYTTEGLLSSTQLGLNVTGTEKVSLQWNNNDSSLDFVFA